MNLLFCLSFNVAPLNRVPELRIQQLNIVSGLASAWVLLNLHVAGNRVRILKYILLSSNLGPGECEYTNSVGRSLNNACWTLFQRFLILHKNQWQHTTLVIHWVFPPIGHIFQDFPRNCHNYTTWVAAKTLTSPALKYNYVCIIAHKCPSWCDRHKSMHIDLWCTCT